MKKLLNGLLYCYKKRGIFHVIKLTSLEIMGNRLGLPVNGNTKELLFWEKQAIGLGDFSENFQNKINIDKQIQIYPIKIDPYIQNKKKQLDDIPKVLDVGCGPISILAHAHHKGDIKLTGADILASSYLDLLKTYGYDDAISGIDMIQTSAEDLNKNLLQKSDFDIVHCNNALDHTNSPAKALGEMVSAAKEGGYIIISGNIREGTHEAWDGIHMHDLYIENNSLWREGKTGDKSRIDENLPVKVTHCEVTERSIVDKMFLVYKKLG